MSAMHLRLSLPPHADIPSADVETRPAELERWLKDQPLLNVAESTHLLTRQLVGHNRTALDDKQRLRLLELLRAPVQHISQALLKTYIGLPLPLSERARQTAAQVRQLQTEMGFGYKLIAFHSTAATKLDHGERHIAGVAIHRAIRYLTQLLFHSYELYSPPPEGTWFEIHQLYRYAELLGITDTALDDKLNGTLPQVSISHAYKQALLLDFADPYHLPAQLLAKIYRYLDRWAPVAQLSPGVAALKSHCQFLINLDHDRAGAVNTETSAITTEVRYRLLNTTELARVVHQQLMVLQAGQHPDPDGLEKDFYANLGHDMLARLINAWGVNPKRVFTRSPRENRQAQVAIGIDAINYFVNGEGFAPSTNEVGPQPRRTALSTGNNISKQKAQQAQASMSASWELTDESAGGYALAKSGAQAEPVRVGDLLASRPGDNGGWEIGSVRWVRTSGADNIEIGVQRMAPGAGAVAVTPLEETKDRHFLALALPEVHAMKQPATLVTHRGFYKAGNILYLDDGFRLRKIKVAALVELSGSFERFQYQFVEG
jgi:hypothetical protein